ncbi:MAG: universal stress protein [Desulfomonile tiedjei]|nr:universal stress protein [Desulfomonile tiedjei]
MYKSILVPLDGSKNDEVVLAHVKTLAKQWGAGVKLILLHRLAPADDPFEKNVQMEDGSSGWRAKRKAETYLPHLEHMVAQEGIKVLAEFLVVEEPEADAIVRYAEDNNCDLIVLANRERSPIGRFFFGNIEEKVRRRSTLPVLFVSVRQS